MRDEPLELVTGHVDDPQGCVASARQLRGRLNEPLEKPFERELGADGDSGLDQALEGRLSLARAHASTLSTTYCSVLVLYVSSSERLQNKSEPPYTQPFLTRNVTLSLLYRGVPRPAKHQPSVAVARHVCRNDALG